MKATFDMPKLERSLKRFTHDFGETSAQAVVRWSVQTCRELALEAQPFGAKQVKETQRKAIVKDAMRVVHAVKESTPAMCKGKRWLATPAAVNEWMDSNRGRHHRTRQLSDADKKICLFTTMKKAVSIRMQNAGIAKGGFLGAGQDIAKAQTGSAQIQIGRNFLSYAQKQTRFGTAAKPQSGFSPVAVLRNSAAHTSTDYVIKRSAIDKAIGWGLRKTINWYRHALKAIDRKRTP